MKLSKLMKAVSNVRDVDRDDILARLGLERRRSPFERLFTIACVFGAGLLVGAGASLLASPVAPADVRKRLGEGVRGMKRELDRGARQVKHEAIDATHHTVQRADEIMPPRPNNPTPPRNGAIKTP